MTMRWVAYGAVSAMAMACAAAPAQAQLFLNPPQFATGPVTGAEPGITLPLPGATAKEQRAALLWNLRSGLNVAALQCQFAPTLQTLGFYNAMLFNHDKELSDAFADLTGYFRRTGKTAKEGQSALDAYGTRTYSSFSAVSAQRTFCQVAGSVGQDALYAPRGKLLDVAINRLRELRGSLVFTREPQMVNPWIAPGQSLVGFPSLDERCWNGKGQLKSRCAPQVAAAG